MSERWRGRCWILVAVTVAAGCGRVSYVPSASPPHDAGMHDAAAHDAGAFDAGAADAGAPDAATPDASAPFDAAFVGDSGRVDPPDAGVDAGAADAGSPACPVSDVTVTAGRVVRDAFGVTGGETEGAIVYVTPGSAALTVEDVLADGRFAGRRVIPATAPEQARIVRTSAGLAVVFAELGSIRAVRLGAVASSTFTVAAGIDFVLPEVAALGDVLGVTWRGGSRTPGDLYFTTVSATDAVAPAMHLSGSAAGSAAVTATPTGFGVVVTDVAGGELARFDATGTLLGRSPARGATPFLGCSVTFTDRYVVAGGFGTSTVAVTLSATGVLAPLEVSIPLPPTGGTVDCHRAAVAAGAIGLPRWRSLPGATTGAIDVAWLALDGTVASLAPVDVRLPTAEPRWLSAAAIGRTLVIAHAGRLTADQPLDVTFACR